MMSSEQKATMMSSEQKEAFNVVEEFLVRLVAKQIETQQPDEQDDDSKNRQAELGMEAFLAGKNRKVGLRFYRDPDGGKSKEYSGARDQKEAFRKAWAASKLRKAKQQRIREDSVSHTDLKHARYRPFSIIWKNQGGLLDPDALQAARNIAEDCIRAGQPWWRMNKRSKRIEFADLDEGWNGDYTQTWALREKREQDKTEANHEQKPGHSQQPAASAK